MPGGLKNRVEQAYKAFTTGQSEITQLREQIRALQGDNNALAGELNGALVRIANQQADLVQVYAFLQENSDKLDGATGFLAKQFEGAVLQAEAGVVDVATELAKCKTKIVELQYQLKEQVGATKDAINLDGQQAVWDAFVSARSTGTHEFPPAYSYTPTVPQGHFGSGAPAGVQQQVHVHLDANLFAGVQGASRRVSPPPAPAVAAPVKSFDQMTLAEKNEFLKNKREQEKAGAQAKARATVSLNEAKGLATASAKQKFIDEALAEINGAVQICYKAAADWLEARISKRLSLEQQLGTLTVEQEVALKVDRQEGFDATYGTWVNFEPKSKRILAVQTNFIEEKKKELAKIGYIVEDKDMITPKEYWKNRAEYDKSLDEVYFNIPDAETRKVLRELRKIGNNASVYFDAESDGV